MEGKYDKVLKELNVTFRNCKDASNKSHSHYSPEGMLSEIADFRESILEMREERYREGQIEISKVKNELAKQKDSFLNLKCTLDTFNTKLDVENHKREVLRLELKQKDELISNLTDELKFLKSEVQVYASESERQNEINKEYENLNNLQKSKNEIINSKIKRLTAENCILISKIRQAKLKKVYKAKNGSFLSVIKGVMKIF